MRYLGIDYGSKRVGLSLSDEEGRMAFPYGVLPNDDALIASIERIVSKEKVGMVVIGHSLDRKGGENPIQEKAKEFMLDLTLSSGVPIEFHPEQYTTKEAMQIQGKNDMTDASAATIILNSYLSARK